MHDKIREHMNVIGADGVHIGTVDGVEGGRIKLTKKDSGGAGFGGGHENHHHYISLGLVAGVEGDRVRLSANGDVAVLFEEEEVGETIDDGSTSVDDGSRG
ncbi:DUF2171 domain-containing protein [Polymorphobacter fuscus]|uniref:DUF2171 domain-containing protein n=1 Tax=Sandarakinorhabdus fusca TaxID=1439888 RepID=A0A7C9LHJ6_9SPHN|nr:DUF2171 domain-containing protein [Polymorphobacter fuscus]KAB7644389.1 DUF2171 domain-containing protein [Polymorphobacter fuscus]MQT18307.1 DUF2171 domain-containing protein [Polymorphobacter fuscus]NJC08203.1 hypothetical protein [Polymorphobacter fuscus]